MDNGARDQPPILHRCQASLVPPFPPCCGLAGSLPARPSLSLTLIRPGRICEARRGVDRGGVPAAADAGAGSRTMPAVTGSTAARACRRPARAVARVPADPARAQTSGDAGSRRPRGGVSRDRHLDSCRSSPLVRHRPAIGRALVDRVQSSRPRAGGGGGPRREWGAADVDTVATALVALCIAPAPGEPSSTARTAAIALLSSIRRSCRRRGPGRPSPPP